MNIFKSIATSVLSFFGSSSGTNTALKIVEKGKGAYYSNPQSVRPQVKSAQQWGVARLYSAVGGGKAAKIDKDLLK